jgi:hypothetical protein
MKPKIVISLLIASLSITSAAAQLPGLVVYDPTNYANALLRYLELQQQLLQLTNSFALALQMAKDIPNMAVRYQALFSIWRNGIAKDTYGNTAGWLNGINSGQMPVVTAGYQQATTQLLPYDGGALASMTPDELSRVESQYASVELADGANQTAMATIGGIRNNAANLETQIGNLEQDSVSENPDLNTEVSVLNKVNNAGILTLRSLQDTNKLLASLLELQTIAAKQQREMTANAINADIFRRATLTANLAQVTSTMTASLETFQMP